jgi:hypothetical protein
MPGVASGYEAQVTRRAIGVALGYEARHLRGGARGAANLRSQAPSSLNGVCSRAAAVGARVSRIERSPNETSDIESPIVLSDIVSPIVSLAPSNGSSANCSRCTRWVRTWTSRPPTPHTRTPPSSSPISVTSCAGAPRVSARPAPGARGREQAMPLTSLKLTGDPGDCARPPAAPRPNSPANGSKGSPRASPAPGAAPPAPPAAGTAPLPPGVAAPRGSGRAAAAAALWALPGTSWRAEEAVSPHTPEAPAGAEPRGEPTPHPPVPRDAARAPSSSSAAASASSPVRAGEAAASRARAGGRAACGRAAAGGGRAAGGRRAHRLRRGLGR